MVRKVVGPDAGKIYAMKVLKKATLKGLWLRNLRIFSKSLYCIHLHLKFQQHCKKIRICNHKNKFMVSVSCNFS